MEQTLLRLASLLELLEICIIATLSIDIFCFKNPIYFSKIKYGNIIMSNTFRLCLITDQFKNEATILKVVLAALEGGIRTIQFRSTAKAAHKLKTAEKLKTFVDAYNGLFIVNSDIALVKQIDASGIHLKSNQCLVAARQELPDKIIGISTHTKEEVQEATKNKADYIFFSPIFKPLSKDLDFPLQGIESLKNTCLNTSLAVFALGGIMLENFLEVYQAGAYGAALSGDIFQSNNPRERALQWTEKITELYGR